MSQEMLDRRVLLAGLGLAGVASLARRAEGGPIDPAPGPVGPTGRTTQEIYDRIARGEAGIAEPRTAIQSLAGSSTAVHVITEPGSYYLTRDIETVNGKDSIRIEANPVSIDLCGFAVSGVSDYAVRLGEGASARITNGTVIGSMRMDPPSAGSPIAILEGLVVRGVVFASRIRMRSCIVEGGSSGGAVIALDGADIDDCQCFSTVGADISGSLRARNSEFAGMSGLIARGRAEIRGCTISGFNATALSVSGSEGSIDGNTVSATGAAGLLVSGTRNLVTRNVVVGGSPAYSIGPGNSFGPIANVVGVGDVSAVVGAQHPWANFVV